MKTTNGIRTAIESINSRSAWDRGVKAYALELLEQLEENRQYEGAGLLVHPLEVEHELLNGARNWSEYSWGASALIYDGDIAARLCTPLRTEKDPQR